MTKQGEEISFKEPAFININIKPKQIINILFFLGLAFILIRLQDTLILLFISFIVMTATKPAALLLNKKFKIPEALAISFIFIFVFMLLVFLIYLLSQPLSDELTALAKGIPQLSANIVNWLSSLPFVQTHVNQDQLSSFLNSIFLNFVDQFNSIFNAIGSAVIGAFRGLILTIFVMIFSIYLFLERENMKKFIIRFFQFKEKEFNAAYEKIESQLGAWVRGQFIFAFIAGISTYIFLLILNIPYALPLSILAGVLQIIPIIGPIIIGLIITLIGFSISPLIGLIIFIFENILQQFINNYLVPEVMKKAVGMSPVVTIISLLIGQELLGITGLFIAIPLTAMVVVVLNIYLDNRDERLQKLNSKES